MKILLKQVPAVLTKWTAFAWFLFLLFFVTLAMAAYKA